MPSKRQWPPLVSVPTWQVSARIKNLKWLQQLTFIAAAHSEFSAVVMGNQFFNLTAADPNTHAGLLHQANAFQTTFQTSLLLFPFRESNFLHDCSTCPVVLRHGKRGEWPMYGVLKLQAIFHHNRSAEISQNCRCHIKTPGARRVTCNKFHTEDTLTLGVTVQNLVATATWRPLNYKIRHSHSGDDVHWSLPRCNAVSTSKQKYSSWTAWP